MNTEEDILERYKRISEDSWLYMTGCPLIIKKYALTMDCKKETLLCQIKFKNLGHETIKAVFVKIEGFNVSGEVTGNFTEYIYNDLLVGRSVEFGGDIGINLNDVNIRIVKIHCYKIIFFDREIKLSDENNYFKKLPKRKYLKDEIAPKLLSEFYLRYREKLRGDILIPYSNDTVRLCQCGEYTLSEFEVCPSCGQKNEWWRENTSVAQLKKFKDEREKREAAEAELKKIEDEKKAAESKLRRDKTKKIATISGCIFFIFVIGHFLITNVVIPEIKYAEAEALFTKGNYAEAVEKFEELGDYSDSEDRINEVRYSEAKALFKKGNYSEAIEKFENLGDYGDSKNRINDILQTISEKSSLIKKSVSGGYWHAVGLKKDGTVVAVGNNMDKQCDVSNWENIISVSANNFHTVGLKAGGIVVAIGDNLFEQCDVSDWKNIVGISAGGYYTVGLKEDRTVVAVGDNEYGQCNILDWKNIITVSAGGFHTVGLKADGTIIAVGYNEYGQCDVSNWKDCISISGGWYHTVGLKGNGTVIAVGENKDKQCDVSNWKNIIAISAGSCHTVGLKEDGTVVAAGSNGNGQCNVSDWKDIVAVSAGSYYTIGLKKDGTVVAVGSNSKGQCNVSDWKDIAVD